MLLTAYVHYFTLLSFTHSSQVPAFDFLFCSILSSFFYGLTVLSSCFIEVVFPLILTSCSKSLLGKLAFDNLQLLRRSKTFFVSAESSMTLSAAVTVLRNNFFCSYYPTFCAFQQNLCYALALNQKLLRTTALLSAKEMDQQLMIQFYPQYPFRRFLARSQPYRAATDLHAFCGNATGSLERISNFQRPACQNFFFQTSFYRTEKNSTK